MANITVTNIIDPLPHEQLAPDQAHRTNFTPGTTNGKPLDMEWPEHFAIPIGNPIIDNFQNTHNMKVTEYYALNSGIIDDSLIPAPVVVGVLTSIATRSALQEQWSIPLQAVDQVLSTFTVPGNYTSIFINGYAFTVTGTTAGALDGNYTCNGNSTYAAGVTTIITVQVIPAGTIGSGVVTEALHPFTGTSVKTFTKTLEDNGGDERSIGGYAYHL